MDFCHAVTFTIGLKVKNCSVQQLFHVQSQEEFEVTSRCVRKSPEGQKNYFWLRTRELNQHENVLLESIRICLGECEEDDEEELGGLSLPP